MQKLQRHNGGGVNVPVGLILGLKDGVAVPEDWSIFSSADDLFLKGTDSDLDVGSTGSRSSVSMSTGTGGSHSGSAAASQRYVAYYSYCDGDCTTTLASGSSVGGHSGHAVPITYRPPASRVRLIKSLEETPIPLSSIMFGLGANPDQALYDFLNNEADTPLMGGATNEILTAIRSASTTGSRSYGHSHWYGTSDRQKLGIDNNYTSFASGGPSHTHSGGTPNITHNLARATVRAFEIIDQRGIDGLIGMWDSPGVPDKWTVVAALVGEYLVFSPTGDGSTSGDNTITVSGSTGSSSHGHGFSGSAYSSCSPLHHSNNLSHNHSYSGSRSYEPERFLIKFIQYTG